MLYVCVGDVMDVVFSICIVRRGGARVWDVCRSYVCTINFKIINSLSFIKFVCHDSRFHFM